MMVGRRKRMVWWPYPVYYGGSDAQQIFDVSFRVTVVLYNDIQGPVA